MKIAKIVERFYASALAVYTDSVWPSSVDHRCAVGKFALDPSCIPFLQIGYTPTAWKLVILRMLLKPDKLPSLTTSYRPISLMSSIMKLFECVIEQRLRSYLEDIGFINKYQSGFRQ